MALYVWEKRVWAGILGSKPGEPNATVRIEVHSAANWTGTLKADAGTQIPNTGVFYVTDREWYGFRVTGVEERTYHIGKPAHTLPSPGRQPVRTATGSVQIIVGGRTVDRGLADVEVFNDDSWTAAIRLEGDDLPLNNGDLFNLRADRGDLMTVGRVDGIHRSGGGDGVSFSLLVVSWQDSPPPL